MILLEKLSPLLLKNFSLPLKNSHIFSMFSLHFLSPSSPSPFIKKKRYQAIRFENLGSHIRNVFGQS